MQNYPFLLQIEYAFEQKNYIAFVMEYCAGGEMYLFYLFIYLEKKNKLINIL